MLLRRTSPPRLAAAISGVVAFTVGSAALSQEIPVVRPSAEVFGGGGGPLSSFDEDLGGAGSSATVETP